jgi:putative membrane protein
MKAMTKFLKLWLPVSVSLVGAPAWAETDWYSWHNAHMTNGHGILGILAMVLFWGIIITLIVLTVRRFGNRRKGERVPTALDILKERLARGEIDPEDYELRRKVLEG